MHKESVVPLDGGLEGLVHLGGDKAQLSLGLLAVDGAAEHSGEHVEVSVLSSSGGKIRVRNTFVSFCHVRLRSIGQTDTVTYFFGSVSRSTPSRS